MHFAEYEWREVGFSEIYEPAILLAKAILSDTMPNGSIDAPLQAPRGRCCDDLFVSFFKTHRQKVTGMFKKGRTQVFETNHDHRFLCIPSNAGGGRIFLEIQISSRARLATTSIKEIENGICSVGYDHNLPYKL